MDTRQALRMALKEMELLSLEELREIASDPMQDGIFCLIDKIHRGTSLSNVIYGMDVGLGFQFEHAKKSVHLHASLHSSIAWHGSGVFHSLKGANTFDIAAMSDSDLELAA